MSAAERARPVLYPAGRLKRLHVHQQRLRAGQPALIVRLSDGSGSVYFRSVDIAGPAEFMQPGDALSCGARAWVETRGEVTGHP